MHTKWEKTNWKINEDRGKFEIVAQHILHPWCLKISDLSTHFGITYWEEVERHPCVPRNLLRCVSNTEFERKTTQRSLKLLSELVTKIIIAYQYHVKNGTICNLQLFDCFATGACALHTSIAILIVTDFLLICWVLSKCWYILCQVNAIFCVKVVVLILLVRQDVSRPIVYMLGVG